MHYHQTLELADLLEPEVEHISRARAAADERLDRAIEATKAKIESAVQAAMNRKIKVTFELDAQA